MFNKLQVSSVCLQAPNVDSRLSHPRLLAFDACMVLLYSAEKLIARWKVGSESCSASGADDTSVPIDKSAVDVERERLDLGPVDGGGLGHG
jgi:hypothetical protein